MIGYFENELLELTKDVTMDKVSDNTLDNDNKGEYSGEIRTAKKSDNVDLDVIQTEFKLGPWHYR